MLTDSHCHLDRLQFDKMGGNLDDALTRAADAGVSRLLCVCISAENRAAVLDIAEAHPHIFASVGVHPSDVNDALIDRGQLAQWSDHPKVVALGETGLDYHYGEATKAIQLESFAEHLIAGAELDLPVIVHTRAAREDTLQLLRAHGGPAAGVLHCFTESWEMASAALDLGYCISISGIVTFRNADELRDVVRKVPLERLLVETDSPYLAPVPYRGKTNQPAYVREVAEYVAQLKGVSIEQLAEATTNNFLRLFRRAA